jgi:hypothetical protein
MDKFGEGDLKLCSNGVDLINQDTENFFSCGLYYKQITSVN